MPNHFHLFIRRSVNPVGRLMSRLQTGYAGYFNRKYHRAGRLFQNRYKAILCDEETYFKELVAYIHLNPFRAGMVKEISELDSFPWSGHGGLVGKANYPWMAVDEVTVRFGSTPRTARQGYRAFLRERAGKEINLSGGGLIRSAGGLFGYFSQNMLRNQIGKRTENPQHHPQFDPNRKKARSRSEKFSANSSHFRHDHFSSCFIQKLKLILGRSAQGGLNCYDFP